MFSELNYVAILVSTLITFVLGILWYGPFFGKEWMKLVGLNKNDAKSPMAPHILAGLLCTFILVTVTSYFISLTKASTWYEGALQGSLLGIGLIATVLFGSVNWEQKPVKLFLINSVYWLINIAITGAIYATWTT